MAVIPETGLAGRSEAALSLYMFGEIYILLGMGGNIPVLVPSRPRFFVEAVSGFLVLEVIPFHKYSMKLESCH